MEVRFSTTIKRYNLYVFRLLNYWTDLDNYFTIRKLYNHKNRLIYYLQTADEVAGALQLLDKKACCMIVSYLFRLIMKIISFNDYVCNGRYKVEINYFSYYKIRKRNTKLFIYGYNTSHDVQCT